MLCINQVCHGVSRCVKDGSYSSSSLEWKSMDSINILLSQQMLHAIKHIRRWQFFLSGRQRTVYYVCVTIQLSENVISCFLVLPGSAKAHVTWCGIVMIAYFISNISAKKCQNPFMCVKVTASQRCSIFWDTVHLCVGSFKYFINLPVYGGYTHILVALFWLSQLPQSNIACKQTKLSWHIPKWWCFDTQGWQRVHALTQICQ